MPPKHTLNRAASMNSVTGNNNNPVNSTTNNNKPPVSKAIAQDHDDEAEDALMARNPREHPFPAFDPAGAAAAKLAKRDLSDAKKKFKNVVEAPAVHVIAAPADPDRPAWRSCIVRKHEDPPPLGLHVSSASGNAQQQQQQQQDTGVSPNAFLLQQERPRWVSIAQTKLKEGCPSRGIPVTELEDPSAVSMRAWSKSRKPGTISGGSLSARATQLGDSRVALTRMAAMADKTSTTTASAASSPEHNNNNSKTLQDKRAEAEAATSARAVGQLLNRMDALPSATRNHLVREAHTLSFLRDSTKAQQEIKKIVVGESSSEIERAQVPQHLLASSRRDAWENQPVLSGRRRAASKTTKKNKNVVTASSARWDDDCNAAAAASAVVTDHDGHFIDFRYATTFEELAQVPERPVGQSAVAALASSARGGGGGADSMPTSGRRSGRRASFPPGAAAAGSSEPQKVLVRLPKVGLQLFGSSVKS